MLDQNGLVGGIYLLCFIALQYKVVDQYPVVLAANRDEARDRPGTPPREVGPGIWAGTDPKAGGTWLGVNAQGRVIAVANRRSSVDRDPGARSRGLLCLDLLTEKGDRSLAAALTEHVAKARYNPFNVLVADTSAAWSATYGEGRLEVCTLEPGTHVIANTLPDSRDDPKVSRALALISPADHIDGAVHMLGSLCRDHGKRSDGADALCVHGPRHGTLSSAVLAVHEMDFKRSRYLHAEGNPCQSEYRDYSRLLGTAQG